MTLSTLRLRGLSGTRCSLFLSWFFIPLFSSLLVPPSLTAAAPKEKKAVPAASAMKVFFTPAAARDENGTYHHLMQLISGAKESLFIAGYKLALFEVMEALGRKVAEGLAVEVLMEKDWALSKGNRAFYAYLQQQGVKVFLDRRNYGLMHHKYLVADRERVFMGSANFSLSSYFHDYNDMVSFSNRKLAELLIKNFFWLSRQAYLNRGGIKTANNPFASLPARTVALGEGEKVELVIPRSTINWRDRLLTFTQNTERRLDFMAFVFSLLPLSVELEKQVRRGVKIRGLLENNYETENITRSWKVIPFARLIRSGAEVKYDDYQKTLHHKAMLRDGEVVLTGSFNFSKNAMWNNEESYLIIHSKPVARQYANRFETLWKRFPVRTIFEEYIVKKNRQLTRLPYEEYRRRHFSNQRYRSKKALAASPFAATVVKVHSAEEVTLQLAGTKTLIPFRLAGVSAPQPGTPFLNQSPHFERAREALTLLAAQEEVQGTITLTTEGSETVRYGFLRRVDAKGKGETKTLNEALLETGMVFLSANTLTEEMAPPMRAAAERSAVKRKAFFENPPLAYPPPVFKERLAEALLERAYREARHSIAYREGCVIGNRKTGRAYRPGHPTYLNYLKFPKDEKLIFFADKVAAEKAGYTIAEERF